MTECAIATNAEARFGVVNQEPNGRYRYRILVCREPEGGFSAFTMDLPGAISQGDTIPEAMQNIVEAIEGLIADYRERGAAIPWKENAVRPEDHGGECFIRSVLVHG
jgi:predicted RNase H-like HicB family nuclease